MRKHTIAIAAAIAVTALVAVPFAFAQHARHMRGDGFGGAMFLGHLGKVKSQLGLTDQQTSDMQRRLAILNTERRSIAREIELQRARVQLTENNQSRSMRNRDLMTLSGANVPEQEPQQRTSPRSTPDPPASLAAAPPRRSSPPQR